MIRRPCPCADSNEHRTPVRESSEGERSIRFTRRARSLHAVKLVTPDSRQSSATKAGGLALINPISHLGTAKPSFAIDMHMHMYLSFQIVRTTVEIPDELRQKLMQEAARRGERGYSAVVERALRRYFDEKPATESRRKTIQRLQGIERSMDTAQEKARADEVRGNWRTRALG